MDTKNTIRAVNQAFHNGTLDHALKLMNAAAHDFRYTLLTTLQSYSGCTAAQLADYCEMPLNRTKQHLRILVKHEIVFEEQRQFDNFYYLNANSFDKIINSSYLIGGLKKIK